MQAVPRSPSSTTTSNPGGSRLAPTLLFIALAVVVLLGFDRGWLPHDDGYLAMSAERVLDGEVPHLDFDEIYTGGLTYLNAWALDTFGMDLAALRVPYLVALAGFVLSVYLICRRFFNRLQAASIASAVVFLSPYVTSTPMPSSYNVFLAGVTLLCVLKYYESRAVHWVLIAGLVSGLGVLAKTTGLYLVLGVGIGLIGFHARHRSSGVDPLGRVLLGTSGLLVTAFVSTQITFSRLVGLVLPIWLVIVMVFQLRSWEETPKLGGAGSWHSLVPYAMGVAAPLLAYGLFQASQGSLDETLLGLVAVPTLFVGQLVRDMSPLVTLTVPLAFFLIVWRLRGPVRSQSNTALAVVLAAVAFGWYVLEPRSELSILLFVFSWAPLLLPVVGLVLNSRGPRIGSSDPIILTTIACAVCMQLVRFPTSNQWYVFYSLPLAVIGFVLLTGNREWARRQLTVAAVVIVGALIGLAGFEGRIFASGPVGARVPFIELEGERSGIEVPVFYDYYNDLQGDPAVQTDTKLAGPDTPELYFLLDIPSSGRSAIPLISEAYGEADSMLAAWQRTAPDTVIINTTPANSDLEPAFVTAVEASCAGPREFGPLRLYPECRGRAGIGPSPLVPVVDSR